MKPLDGRIKPKNIKRTEVGNVRYKLKEQILSESCTTVRTLTTTPEPEKGVERGA